MAKIKSFIVDANNYLDRIFLFFDFFYKELLLSFRIVENFSNCFYFHPANYKDKKCREAYFWKLNKNFEDVFLDPNSIIIIANTSIKNNITSLISYVHSNLDFITQTVYHAINVTLTKAKLFAIRYKIN